jgi:very-short-patch-repair endonuclease
MKRKIIPYNPKLKLLARKLRNDSTRSEIKLWQHLKGKQLLGYDFHRQKPLLNFIADFYCYELKLVIELDGYSHQIEEVQLKDKIKQNELEEVGLTVLRFEDDEVMNDIENVLRELEAFARKVESDDFSSEEKEDNFGGLETRSIAGVKEHTPSPSQEGNMEDEK